MILRVVASIWYKYYEIIDWKTKELHNENNHWYSVERKKLLMGHVDEEEDKVSGEEKSIF